jgi:hypothetical protein
VVQREVSLQRRQTECKTGPASCVIGKLRTKFVRSSYEVRTKFVRSSYEGGRQGVQGTKRASFARNTGTSYEVRTKFVRSSYEVRTKLGPTGADKTDNKCVTCMERAYTSQAYTEHVRPRWASCTAAGEECITPHPHRCIAASQSGLPWPHDAAARGAMSKGSGDEGGRMQRPGTSWPGGCSQASSSSTSLG